jgi:hypothetical protein
MGDMDISTDEPELSIECATCPATGTTACGDCVITHLLANDDGPIEYEPTDTEIAVTDRCVPDDRIAEIDRVVVLFAAAGRLDDPPLFVTPEAFERATPEPPAFRRDLAGSTRG